MKRNLMIQGTMSGAGKSLLVTALCRIFHQDGWSVAPFKSQNMALNSYVTADGKEMGRAQVLQAQAAGKAPDVRMNPILLKPSSDVGSQVIVNGEVRGDYRAKDYFRMKRQLIPDILAAYHSLAEENDILVIEGAGSPAEINLKADDIVNMGLAKMVNAPVLLVGDIDPGGVFAQLYGTVALLEEEERRRVRGTIINKFRGDAALLQPGLAMLEERMHVPVLGVVPYTRVDLDDEDSQAPRLLYGTRRGQDGAAGRWRTTEDERSVSAGRIDIVVIRLPHISNFTDFTPLERHPDLQIRYVARQQDLGAPDLVILPGTKNTMGDIRWLRDRGLETAIKCLHTDGTPILGICGGYQMLGEELNDPDGVEHGGTMRGMELLSIRTVFAREKVRTQTEAVSSAFEKDARIRGYQIHMGRTDTGNLQPFCHLSDGSTDGAVQDGVFGTYLHGLFDSGELTAALADWLLERRGLERASFVPTSHQDDQEQQINLLADVVRQSLDMDAIYRIMEEYAHE